MIDDYQVLIRPLFTEKSSFLQEKYEQVCFQIDPRANKVDVRRAIEKLFDRKAAKVQIVWKRGKKKRFGRYVGYRSDIKKAVVTLKEGEKPFEFFERA